MGDIRAMGRVVDADIGGGGGGWGEWKDAWEEERRGRCKRVGSISKVL